MQPNSSDFELDVQQQLKLEDDRLNTYLKMSWVVIVVLVVGLGGWMTLTKISGAVVSSGKIIVEANSKSVQHLEGGIVTNLAVREGESVREGQLLLRLDANQINEAIKGLESQVKAKKAQLKLLGSELDDLSKLAAKRLVPRSRLAAAQRSVAQLQGELGKLVSESNRTSVNRQRLDVLAPIAGRVLDLQVHTVGGVVGAGQEILKIVPSGARLIIESKIRPRDIDQVARGQSVAITLSSFSQRNTPELRGTVTNISADLLTDVRQQNYHYVAHVNFNSRQLQRLGKRSIVPGMPVEVYIQTETRTVLDYLVKPLSEQFRRALREE